MAGTGKTVATLLIGAAVGTAIGYVLGTDKNELQGKVDELKSKLSDFKNRFSQSEDHQEEVAPKSAV